MSKSDNTSVFYQIQAIIISLLIITGAICILLFYDFSVSVNVEDEVTPRKKISVMMLVNGTYDDGTWSESHVKGFIEAVNQLGVKAEIHEKITSESCEKYIDRFAQNGGSLVIVPTAVGATCVDKASKKYPELFFMGVGDGSVIRRSNVMSYMGRMYNVRYLSGVIAAMATDSKDFGYVVAMLFPETIRGIDAFTLGVKSVRPNAIVHVVEFGSWDEQAKIDASLDKLFGKYPNIQLVTYHIDTDEVNNFCAKNGILCIAYHEDKNDFYQQSNLANAVWNWSSFYKREITKVNVGIFVPGFQWVDFQSGNAMLSNVNYKLLPSYASDTVDRISSKMINGQFDVFSGPIYDNNGMLRVQKGEKLSDEYLMQKIDWFVDGVDKI